jgi:hypothetical protein
VLRCPVNLVKHEGSLLRTGAAQQMISHEVTAFTTPDRVLTPTDSVARTRQLLNSILTAATWSRPIEYNERKDCESDQRVS